MNETERETLWYGIGLYITGPLLGESIGYRITTGK